MPRPEEIENWFTYHPPTPEQIEQYATIRDKAKEFAHTANALIPESADKTAAFRQLREAVHMFNAAIACNKPAEAPHGK